VDDEAIVREGISRVVPWGENGFELSGLFENGEQALSFIEKNPVDIIITDINMPRMDGLTLSRILAERFPKIMVLLLTGFDDFEYAQEAVKNQVRELLLKPITAEELRELLARMKDELDLSREQDRQQEIMQEKLEQSFPLLRERFLYRLVSGRLGRENLVRRGEYFQWLDRGEYYQSVVMSIPESWDDIDALTLSEYLKQQVYSGDEVFSNREGDVVLLLQGSDEEELETRSRVTTEGAFLHTSRLEKDQITAGCGEVVNTPFQLHASYRSACNALDYTRVLGISQILSIHDVRDRKRISMEGFNSLIRQLMVDLRTGSSDKAQEDLREIFTFFENHYLTMSEASGYLTRLHFLMIYFLQEMDLISSTDLDPLFSPPGSFGSLNHAKTFFFKVLARIQEIIQGRRHDVVLSRVDRARQIISERFQKNNFSLKDICDELYLSTSQFSHLFKEGTGQTFVEYLTAFRVEEAKKLLKTTDLKGYEVAEQTGFSDPRYFSIVFKKQTGLTAMEYRKGLDS